MYYTSIRVDFKIWHSIPLLLILIEIKTSPGLLQSQGTKILLAHSEFLPSGQGLQTNSSSEGKVLEWKTIAEIETTEVVLADLETNT